MSNHRTFGRVACIKASRPPGSIPELTFERMRDNASQGIVTQLVPDCNVVIDMVRASSNEETEQRQVARNRLGPFTDFLRACQRERIRYYISPYIGLNEMRRAEAALAPGALSAFSATFVLGWIDTHPNLQPDLETVGLLERGLSSLDIEWQTILAVDYSGLLLMLVVARDLAHLSPLAKFRTYLKLYRRIIDIVSVRDIMIARFVFAPEPSSSERIYTSWKNISLNFTGRKCNTQRLPKTFRQMDRTAVNGALDLFILNSALLSDYRGLAGERLDTWVVTADLKLAALTDAVHHTDGGTGETGRYLVTEDYSDVDEYWYQTHTDMQQLGRQARIDLKPSSRLQHARALMIVALAEQGLQGQIRSSGVPLRHQGAEHVGARPNGVLVEPPFQ